MAGSVLITGAGGLIGDWVLRHWDDSSVELMPVRRRDVDLLVRGAARDVVESSRPDHVVHLAWCASGTDGYRHADDNQRWLDTTLELREACRRVGAGFWATGTVVDNVASPTDAYTEAKTALRRILADDIEHGTIGWFRPHYVFDETRRKPALVALAMAARDNGITVELRTPDDAHDFVHASDVGRAIAMAVRRGMTGEIPIGSGTKRRVVDLVQALGVRWRSAEDSATTVAHVGSTADVSRLREIDWTPTMTKEFFKDD